VIDRPIGTVKTRLHRARAELADDLTRRGVQC
jgi:RNA polymerase sigma-70 factor (ECF subfamily)